jgi:hypothetical protein
MNRQNKKMANRWSGISIFIAALIIVSSEAQAKVYSVQVGAFQIYANAQDRYNLLKKTTPSHLLDQLRIERKGKLYKVKVGKTEDSEKATNLLLALEDSWPDAFVVPEETKSSKSEIITRQKEESVQSIAPLTSPKKRPPSLEKRKPELAGKADSTSSSKKTEMTGTISEISSLTSPKKRPPSLEKKEPGSAGKADSASSLKKAEMTGTISEISSINSEELGLPPGNTIYQLFIWVQGTRDVSESPDIPKVRIGELSMFFSETRPPVLIAGNKIKAMVEYRGNRYSSHYWIVQPQMAKP